MSIYKEIDNRQERERFTQHVINTAKFSLNKETGEFKSFEYGEKKPWCFDVAYMERFGQSEKLDYYFVVNQTNVKGKPRNEDITGINYIYLDVDDTTKEINGETIWHVLKNEKIFWSHFVITGPKSCHFYFRIDGDNNNLELGKKVQKKFAQKFAAWGVDKKVCDLSRILRLPGTKNTKYTDDMYVYVNYSKSNRVDVVDFSGYVYTLKDLNEWEFESEERRIASERELVPDNEPVIATLNKQIVVTVDSNGEHTLFFNLLAATQQRHAAFLQYDNYLKHFALADEQRYEILKMLRDQTATMKERIIHDSELKNIMDSNDRYNRCTRYVWNTNQQSLFDKEVERVLYLLNQVSDIYFMNIFYRLVETIKFYGPVFFLSTKNQKLLARLECSSSTLQKLIKMLIDFRFLIRFEKGIPGVSSSYAVGKCITVTIFDWFKEIFHQFKKTKLANFLAKLTGKVKVTVNKIRVKVFKVKDPNNLTLAERMCYHRFLDLGYKIVVEARC